MRIKQSLGRTQDSKPANRVVLYVVATRFGSDGKAKVVGSKKQKEL
jgi:hypothetical protein